MRPLVPVLMVSLLGACGGSVVSADGGRDGGASACPSRVVAGEACGSIVGACLANDRCNDCYCNTGVWVCESRVCNDDAGMCPAGRPRTGDACPVPRQVCGYGTGCSGANCVCAGGQWTCDTQSCPDR